MKILILKVSAIGDVIHTLPAVFYLKKCCQNTQTTGIQTTDTQTPDIQAPDIQAPDIQAPDIQAPDIQAPDIQISWVVQKKASDLILNQPFLDKVYVLPDKFLHPKNWAKTFKVVRELRRTKWDAIIDFQGIHKTSLLISMLNGRKFGFDAKLARSKFSTYFTHEQVSQDNINDKFKNIIQKNLALADFVTQALCNASEGKANETCINQCPSIIELKKSFTFKFDQAGIDTVDEWLTTNVSNPARSSFDTFCSAQPRKTLRTSGVELPDRSVELPDRSVELPDRSVELPDRSVELPARGECARSACIDVSAIALQERRLEPSPNGRRAESAKFFLLCPNTTWPSKHWPNEYWIEFIKTIAKENLQHKILLIGQNFGQAAEQIAQACTAQKLPVYIIPAWDLNTTAFLISKADLLIAPDTGLLHLADFLDTTTIGIFGPTNKDIQGPFLKDVNIGNAIQVQNQDDKAAIQANDCTVNDSANDSNFKKTTTCQNNMYKLKPSVLVKKVLQILKNQN